MLYLLTNNFAFWDFYCINYLLSDQEFRKNLNNLSSKGNSLNKIFKGFFNTEVDLKPDGYLKEVTYKFSLYDKKLSIILTDENKINYLNTFLPFKIKTSNTNLQIQNNFIFDFHFHHTIILTKIMLRWNLTKFIKKILKVDFNKQIITLDYDYLDRINDDFLKFTTKYDEFTGIGSQKMVLHLL